MTLRCRLIADRDRGFPGGSVAKNLPAKAGDAEEEGSIPGSEDPLERPTPVFLPGESHGEWSLVGYGSWGHKQSDMTERLSI